MPFPQLDRNTLDILPLSKRENKLAAERDMVLPGTPHKPLGQAAAAILDTIAERIRNARQKGAPVMISFGAHTIKNGLGPVLIDLMEDGWLQHLATNGAGIIHDWEFSFQGKTSEDVRKYTAEGQFGIWEETGHHLNLALLLGAYSGLGYGESVGRLIASEQHVIPSHQELMEVISHAQNTPADAERASAACDLLAKIQSMGLQAGPINVPHPWKKRSVQARAFELGVPFTAHPMFGHDIIYTHPMNHGAAIGRTAQRDFLAFAANVANLSEGVYLSVGSAVMSPMIFEKSMSMANNLARQAGGRIHDHFIAVIDLAESRWDWSQGEPPPESPDYYLRYCKTFSRMGGEMRYLTIDNRDFLLALNQKLKSGK